MRRFIYFALLLFTFIAWGNPIYAQPKRRPLPDWVWEKPERSSGNRTFYYHVEKGWGETETEARNAAYTQAFMQVALKLGIPLNTEDISEAVASGTNVRMLSQRFTIPMNVACFTSRPNTDMGGWDYYLLCQIPEVGYADRARFDDFNDCFKFDKYKQITAMKDSIREKEKQDSVRIVRSANAKALVASTFIPGMGQMMKHQWGKGTAFLLSEVVLLGGGTACYFLANQQNTAMMDAKSSYDDYQNSKKLKKTYETAMYVCFGVGAAIHIANMAHAWLVPDKRNRSLSLVPALIPENEYTQPTFAYGVGLQYKF